MHFCQIKETTKDGKFYRECSNCKADVTKITQWISYNFCPWCGAKVLKNVDIQNNKYSKQ